jgi:hypothetical protein
MKPLLALAICCVLQCTIYAQTIANGNFNSGTASWGCNPETNAESVYGGSSTTNTVAEVDAVAGLCQTINGLTIGALYRVSFLCSRRTSCGPTVQSMNVTISGGVATKSISRNGTGFSMTTEFVDFVPTAIVHTLTFTGTTTETCNLLVDNIQITLSSGLPVELSSFTASCSNGSALLNWITESETRSDYFTIDSSTDGSSWKEVAQVDASFNSQTKTPYSYQVDRPADGINYYRLRLTDIDGTEEILSVVSLICENEQVLIYPNPTTGVLTVNAGADEFAGIFDASGRNVSETIMVLNKAQFEVDLSGFSAGLYYLQIGDKRHKLLKE